MAEENSKPEPLPSVSMWLAMSAPRAQEVDRAEAITMEDIGVADHFNYMPLKDIFLFAYHLLLSSSTSLFNCPLAPELLTRPPPPSPSLASAHASSQDSKDAAVRALQGTNFAPEEGADIMLLQLLFSMEGFVELVTEGKMTRDKRHEGWRFYRTRIPLTGPQWGFRWCVRRSS